MSYIKVYTRSPIDNIYPKSLANSVHFAYSRDGREFQPLNQDYGILFALADIREDNTLGERGIREPRLCREGSRYLIFAEPVDAAGNPIEDGKLLQWETEDFVTFSEQKAVEKAAVGERKAEGTLEIPEALWEGIRDRWIPLHSVSVKLPEDVKLRNVKELESVRARVIYSDGSVDEKKVSWDWNHITDLGGGRYRVSGSLRAVEARFPLAVGYADPVVFAWQGSWYFLATNDNVNDIGLFVRRADSVEGLFAKDVEEHCILACCEEKGFVQTFWAPEFHVIGGDLYILFAVSGSQWGPQCHMMRLKRGGDITNPQAWEEPVRVCRENGKPLTEDGITLDMTYFKAGERPYLVWSYRYGIGTPKDTGSMLYIAAADEKTPWRLASEPVLLSRPLFGWENNSGTINNEGPYALLTEEKVYLAYSGGDACGYYYVVGYLTASVRDDLLDVSRWHKEPTPAFSSSSIEGIQGPGHNSFFTDEEGRLMIAYHAQEREKYFKRCTAMHRVHLSKSGMPMLNVAGERDLAKELERVEIEFSGSEGDFS